jgi:hypothetical protein
MSSTSSPGNPEAEHDAGDDNGDAAVLQLEAPAAAARPLRSWSAAGGQ